MKKMQTTKFFLGIVTIMFFYCLNAWANGNGSSNNVGLPKDTAVSTAGVNSTYSRGEYSSKSTTVSANQNTLSVVVKRGFLKANVQRIARRYGWKNVVWKSDEDYYWRGTITVSGANIEEVMRKILYGYPLQAVFYYGNRVLVILPRTLK